MPRRKPTEVVVNRFEMGDWERDKVETIMLASAIPAGAGIAAAGVGVAAAGLGAWFALQKRFAFKQEVAETLDKVTKGLGSEVVFGRGTYTDEDGNEVQNPFAGIPVLGSLFGSGVMIGQAFNPVTTAREQVRRRRNSPGGGGGF